MRRFAVATEPAELFAAPATLGPDLAPDRLRGRWAARCLSASPSEAQGKSEPPLRPSPLGHGIPSEIEIDRADLGANRSWSDGAQVISHTSSESAELAQERAVRSYAGTSTRPRAGGRPPRRPRAQGARRTRNTSPSVSAVTSESRSSTRLPSSRRSVTRYEPATSGSVSVTFTAASFVSLIVASPATVAKSRGARRLGIALHQPHPGSGDRSGRDATLDTHDLRDDRSATPPVLDALRVVVCRLSAEAGELLRGRRMPVSRRGRRAVTRLVARRTGGAARCGSARLSLDPPNPDGDEAPPAPLGRGPHLARGHSGRRGPGEDTRPPATGRHLNRSERAEVRGRVDPSRGSSPVRLAPSIGGSLAWGFG